MNLRRHFFWLLLAGILALQPNIAFAGDSDSGSDDNSQSDSGDDGDRGGDRDDDVGGNNGGGGHNYDGDDDNDEDSRDSDYLDLTAVPNSASGQDAATTTQENRALNEATNNNAASLKEVFRIVRNSYKGEIVHVSLSGSGDQLTYGIKLLDTAGYVIDLQVNAKSRAIAFSPGS